MSKTIAQVRDGVRTLLRDRNAADSMVNTFELTKSIQREADRLFEEIGLAPTWETGIISTVAGTYEYTVSVASGKSHLIQVVALRLASRNWPIYRITDDELETMRRGPSTAVGIPQYASLRETDAQTLKVRIWPIPNEADTIDWLRSWAPAWSADTDSITLSDHAIGVLEKRVVRYWLSVLPQEVIQNRQIAKDAIAQLSEDINTGVRLERIRINQLKRTGRLSRTQA